MKTTYGKLQTLDLFEIEGRIYRKGCGQRGFCVGLTMDLSEIPNDQEVSLPSSNAIKDAIEDLESLKRGLVFEMKDALARENQ